MPVIAFALFSWQKQIQLDFLQFFDDVPPVTQEASSLLNEPVGTPEVEVLCRFTESCCGRRWQFGLLKGSGSDVGL